MASPPHATGRAEAAATSRIRTMEIDRLMSAQIRRRRRARCFPPRRVRRAMRHTIGVAHLVVALNCPKRRCPVAVGASVLEVLMQVVHESSAACGAEPERLDSCARNGIASRHDRWKHLGPSAAAASVEELPIIRLRTGHSGGPYLNVTARPATAHPGELRRVTVSDPPIVSSVKSWNEWDPSLCRVSR